MQLLYDAYHEHVPPLDRPVDLTVEMDNMYVRMDKFNAPIWIDFVYRVLIVVAAAVAWFHRPIPLMLAGRVLMRVMAASLKSFMENRRKKYPQKRKNRIPLSVQCMMMKCEEGS